jgi:GT2 family glycosyltransferase
MRKVIAPAPTRPVEPRRAAPTFSVVIAAYEAAHTIGEAVESGLAQTVRPHEVIVCDDGSTDDLDSALAPYGGEVRLLRQEHHGAASARNNAARAASGEFIAVLDADDAYLPERLEALGELAAARPDLDLLGTDAWYVLDGRRSGRFNGERNPFPSEGQRNAILQRCFLVAPAIRRSTLLEADGWDESLTIAEDWDCWMRLILDGRAAGLVAEPLMEYRLRDESLSAQRLDSFRARVSVLEKNASHPSLREEERPRLAAALARHRRNLAAVAAEEATLARVADARNRWLAIAREPSFGRRARLRAATLSVVPRGLARGLIVRARSSGRSRAAGRRPPG